jgi:hypothetical protein
MYYWAQRDRSTGGCKLHTNKNVDETQATMPLKHAKRHQNTSKKVSEHDQKHNESVDVVFVDGERRGYPVIIMIS